MKGIQYKSVQGKVADVDTGGRTVVFYASAFGNEDSQGDVMMPGCFAKSIRDWGSEGKNRIVHLADHWPDTEHLLSRSLLLEEDSFGLKCTSTIAKTRKGDDILALYESGAINEHSIGFSVVKDKFKIVDNTCYFSEVKLFEVSSVVFGANQNTPTIGMKSLTEIDYDQQRKTWNSYRKLIEKSGVSDETCILMDLYIEQLLTATEQKSTQQTPVTEQVVAVPSLETFFATLKANL